MNNEPVAWMQTFTQEYKGVTETKHAVNIERIGINDIPLYTHPAKTLTDEEILEIAQPMFEDARYPSTALDFARAILKKASEK